MGTRVSDKTPPAEYQGKHYRVRTAEASALLVEEWHGTDERETIRPGDMLYCLPSSGGANTYTYVPGKIVEWIANSGLLNLLLHELVKF